MRHEFVICQCRIFAYLIAWNLVYLPESLYNYPNTSLAIYCKTGLSIFFLILIWLWNRYVHAELHGASSTVIKNHRPEQPVPPLTLNQAGCYTVSLWPSWNAFTFVVVYCVIERVSYHWMCMTQLFYWYHDIGLPKRGMGFKDCH